MQFSDRQQIECCFVGWNLFDSIGHEWRKAKLVDQSQPSGSRHANCYAARRTASTCRERQWHSAVMLIFLSVIENIVVLCPSFLLFSTTRT